MNSVPSDYKTIPQWVEAEGRPAVPSRDVAERIISRHRKLFLDSGEYIPGAGRRPSLVGRGFGKLVMDVIRREAGVAA